MSKKSEKGNVIELVVIGVLVLTVVGLLVWRFVGSNQTQTKTEQSSSEQSTESATAQAGTQASLKQFTSSKYLIRFNYPSSWSVKEVVNEDTADWYQSVVTVKNASGTTVAQLGTSGQFGGACTDDQPWQEATTVSDKATVIKGLETAHYGYTIVKGTDNSYGITYGLNNGELPVGVQKVQCPGMAVGYKYIVHSKTDPVGSMTFGSWRVTEDAEVKTFTSFDEAKLYATSDEMKQVEVMIASLSIGE